MTSPIEELLRDACNRYSGAYEEVKSILTNHPNIDINCKDQDHFNWTPLHYASLYGHAEVVELLLNHPGINPNSESIHQQTAFALACVHGRVGAIRVMLRWCPNLDVNKPSNMNATPLWFAARNGELACVQEILASRKTIDLHRRSLPPANFSNVTAKEAALQLDHKNVVELLDAFEADPHGTTQFLRRQLGYNRKN